jgi:hypothetical protein
MVPPEPAVVTTLRGFKADLLAQEAAQQVEMAKRWIGVERSLEGQIDALSLELANLAKSGVQISPGKIYRLERYQKLLAQAQEQTALYARYADGLITQRQTALVALGVEHAVEAVGLVGPIGMAFDRLSSAAVESMIALIAGKAGDGGSLGQLLLDRMVKQPGAWERLTTNLVNAVAQGWNPRKTARMMRDDLSQGLDKALVIARSEEIRAYKTANLQSYQASGAVRGIMRLTAHDSRVCGACLADEGTVYPVDTIIPDHPQGRCGQIPVVNGARMPEWTRGEDWFKTQPEDVQRSILGPGKYDAWKEGRFGFGELKMATHNATWGEGVKVASLKDLGIAKAGGNIRSLPTRMDFATNTEAAEWARNHYGAIIDPGQLASLRRYQSAGYQGINPGLRGKKALSDLNRQDIKAIDKALQANPLPADVTVMRGTGLTAFGGDIDALQGMVGTVITDKGYTSSALTVKIPTAFKNKQVIMRINVPQGTPSYYMPSVATDARMRAEQELLLGRGQRMMIDSVRYNPRSGKWEVGASVLPT